MTRRVNVRAIIWRDGKILAVKHRKDDGSEQPYWATPGGGVDDMEGLSDAVTRELKEELGINAVAGKLLFMQQYRSGRDGFDEEMEFFFLVNDSQLFDDINLAASSHGLEEISRVAFIDPKNEDIMPAFLGTINFDEYITGDKPIYIANNLDSES